MKIPFSGGCACGSVSYECSTKPLVMLNCHCRDCQYSSGAPYASGFVVAAEHFEYSGKVSTYTVIADSGAAETREFCPTCGSPLFSRSEASAGYISVRVSTLDDPTGFVPSMDIWVCRAYAWTPMNENLPRFDKNPG